MNLSNILSRVAPSFNRSSTDGSLVIGDVVVASKGPANDLAPAGNDTEYRPHIVERRDARRRRRDVRMA